MSQTARVFSYGAACIVWFGAAGCGGATESTVASTPPASELLITAAPFSPSCPQAGKVLAPGPGVMVTDWRRRPASGIEVAFRAGPDDQLSHSVAFTDVEGGASTGSWRLSEAQGAHSIVASVVGGPSTTIQVTTEVGSPINGAFDLVAIGGKQLPANLDGSNLLTAGHLYFAENRTSRVTYEWNGQTDALAEVLCDGTPFVVSSSQIDFFLPLVTYSGGTPVTSLGQHFATAIVRGDTLSVKYDNEDFDDEVYVLRSGVIPLAGR